MSNFRHSKHAMRAALTLAAIVVSAGLWVLIHG